MLHALSALPSFQAYIALTRDLKYALPLSFLDYDRLEFNNYESYKTWRTVWRNAYRDLATFIKQTKRIRAIGSQEAQSIAQAKAAAASAIATLMLQQRAASKHKAAALRTQQRSQIPMPPLVIKEKEFTGFQKAYINALLGRK